MCTAACLLLRCKLFCRVCAGRRCCAALLMHDEGVVSCGACNSDALQLLLLKVMPER
jgi:hypothetical protein